MHLDTTQQWLFDSFFYRFKIFIHESYGLRKFLTIFLIMSLVKKDCVVFVFSGYKVTLTLYCGCKYVNEFIPNETDLRSVERKRSLAYLLLRFYYEWFLSYLTPIHLSVQGYVPHCPHQAISLNSIVDTF